MKWQTRRSQKPVGVTPWRFKSSRPHQYLDKKEGNMTLEREKFESRIAHLRGDIKELRSQINELPTENDWGRQRIVDEKAYNFLCWSISDKEQEIKRIEAILKNEAENNLS